MRLRLLDASLSRRRMLAVAGCGLAAPAHVLAQAPERLVFDIQREGRAIGRHEVAIARGADGEVTARIEAEFVVRIGPVPVYRYRHTATETWRAGRFASLSASTIENGGRREVVAAAGPGGVRVAVNGREGRLAADVCPLTHWNADSLRGALFNAQTGALLAEHLAAHANPDGGRTVELTGDAAMTVAYDAQGRWLGLRLKAPDRSVIAYVRR